MANRSGDLRPSKFAPLSLILRQKRFSSTVDRCISVSISVERFCYECVPGVLWPGGHHGEVPSGDKRH